MNVNKYLIRFESKNKLKLQGSRFLETRSLEIDDLVKVIEQDIRDHIKNDFSLKHAKAKVDFHIEIEEGDGEKAIRVVIDEVLFDGERPQIFHLAYIFNRHKDKSAFHFDDNFLSKYQDKVFTAFTKYITILIEMVLNRYNFLSFDNQTIWNRFTSPVSFSLKLKKEELYFLLKNKAEKMQVAKVKLAS